MGTKSTSQSVSLLPNAASTESLKLMFDLDAATSDQEDLMLPLDEGMVEVWVTMAPTEKPDMVDADTEYFAVNYIPADGVVAFTIAPASCTLLFPYAAVWEGVWNTGIAIANPSAFTDTPLSGDITFTLFPNDGEMIMHSTDGMSSGRVWTRMDLFLRGTPTPCCSAKSWLTQACPVIS